MYIYSHLCIEIRVLHTKNALYRNLHYSYSLILNLSNHLSNSTIIGKHVFEPTLLCSSYVSMSISRFQFFKVIMAYFVHVASRHLLYVRRFAAFTLLYRFATITILCYFTTLNILCRFATLILLLMGEI